jgi:Transposase DNA-binding
MDAAVTVNGFGREHFGKAQLGDRRRTERLVKAADQVMCHPCGTLPQKLSGLADLKALYRLVGRREVTHEAVLATHRQRTLRLMGEHPGVVLTVHDTTQLDYTSRRSLRDLGQIAKGNHRGYLCHNTLAVDAASGDVIGLASQILHKRPRVKKGETLKQRRERADRETRLWKAGSEAVGPAPAGCTWVDVCDRGADVFEYLDHKHATGGLYVVRSKHDRNVEACGELCKLHAHARSLPDLGTMAVSVGARPAKPGVAARKAREAVVRVAAGPVTLPVPLSRAGDHGDQPLAVWVVHVKELDPPAGEKPLEWVLLTNVPTESLEQAKERVGWYARRPVIEEYHKGQKTGCGIELPQLTDESRLQPVIALLSVVAVMLLNLRDAARSPEAQHRPAAELAPPQYVRVLSGWRWQDPDRPTTAAEFLLAVARLGGHLNRKADGLPGWLTIWRGWSKLHHMVLGASAVGAPEKRCG